MSARLILILFVLLFLVVSCSAEPETVIETVVHEATVVVKVTRLVEQEVEVTREVEITHEVEVPVEVTRIVEIERVITATPEPTPEPTMTATVAATAAPAQPSTPEPVQDLATTFLEQMENTRRQMQSFGGQIDAALRGDPFSCLDSVYLYDAILSAPTMDVSSASAEVQNAYGRYRASIDIFRDGAKDMAGNCREVVDGTKQGTTIPFQQWGLARQQVDQAIGILSPAIQMLGGE